MDGYLLSAPRAAGLYAPGTADLFPATTRQRTLSAPIGCTGTGLHSGRSVRVELLPAPAHAGIVFRRTDLGLDFPARFDRVCDTRLCTVLGDTGGTVGTVEHLLAAVAAAGIGNLLVEVDGPELPVLDGSAEPWTFLLDCAGIADLEEVRTVVEIVRPVRVEDGAAFAELRPGRADCLELSLAIEFGAAAIGRQSLTLALEPHAFRAVARARTFAQAHEIAGLQAAGLALGGTLDNAVVVDGARVLNPAGLRMADEFVRHKLLDAVGDLALGGDLRGRFNGFRSGHALNNRVLRALFADAANYRLVDADGLGWMRNAA